MKVKHRPKLLDLCSGEGCAAAGYSRAGFEVHGWDIRDLRDRYLKSGAESFTKGDAMKASFEGYDAVHVFTPCEDMSPTMGFGLADRGTEWMLPFMIDRLRSEFSGPWIVENVESRKVRGHMGPGAVRLCGSAFHLGAHDSRGRWRMLRRHRLFLSNVPVQGVTCTCRGKLVGGVYGHGEQGVNGGRGYGFAADAARVAMGTPWVSRDGCADAIPPAYAYHFGVQLAAYIESGMPLSL